MDDKDNPAYKAFEKFLTERPVLSKHPLWDAFQAGAEYALDQIRDVVPTESKRQAG